MKIFFRCERCLRLEPSDTANLPGLPDNWVSVAVFDGSGSAEGGAAEVLCSMCADVVRRTVIGALPSLQERG